MLDNQGRPVVLHVGSDVVPTGERDTDTTGALWLRVHLVGGEAGVTGWVPAGAVVAGP